MNTLLIPAGQDLIEEIITHLDFTGPDYSGNIVVFPGRRPAHFLRKALAGKVKKSFIPPRVFSMDEFIDFAYEKDYSGRKTETIDAVAVLYDIHKKAADPIGGSSFLSPDAFFPIGLKIYSDLEELLIEGIQPYLIRQVETYALDGIPEKTLRHLQSLSFFYKEFYETTDRLHLSTRSVRYRKVSENINEDWLAKYDRIIFSGFFALTGSEKGVFSKLLSMKNTLFIFQEGDGIHEKLNELGISMKSTDKITNDRISNPGPDIQFYSSPDSHGQVFALAGVLESSKGNQKPIDEKTAIVLPSSETLFPVFHQCIPVLGNHYYNISLGYPLLRTPVFGFLNNLMELITTMDEDRFYIPDYQKFVLHPYTKNIYCNGRSEITRIMFHSIEEALSENKARNFLLLSDLENDDDLMKRIMDRLYKSGYEISKDQIKQHLRNIHSNTIERFVSFRDIRDFSVKCRELLIYIYNNSTARLHPLFYPFSESFIRSLDTLMKSMINEFSFMENAGYFTFFRKYIMTCYSPFEGTPVKGLQMLGFLETRNLKFSRVFILDVNEDVLPDIRKDDTLLPFTAREALGLPTYRDRDKITAYYFDLLLKGAEEVHLFFMENDRRERSRFVEKLLWEKQKKDKTTGTKGYLQSVQYKVRLDNPVPDAVNKTAAAIDYLREFVCSATALDSYLSCQLQFYYTYVLRLNRKEAVTGDIERTDIGKFVHKTLAAFFLKKTNRQLKESDIRREEIDKLIEGLFNEEYGNFQTGAVYLLKKQIKRHLKDVLSQYYKPLIKESPVAVLNTEYGISIPYDSFHLKGRLDSIEKRGDKIFIIDYKTGSNPNRLRINFEKLDAGSRVSWDKAIGSLQLPFYLLLYTHDKGVHINELEGMFLLLGRSTISREIELSLFEKTDKQAAFETLKKVISGLLKEINDPAVPFAPSINKKETCPACIYRNICGTQWIAA